MNLFQSTSSYEYVSRSDVSSAETVTVVLSAVLDGVYRGLETETVCRGPIVVSTEVSMVISVLVTSVVKASVVVVGYNLEIVGFFKGLLPLKGLLLRPCRPLVHQTRSCPPDPDDNASSGFSIKGGLTVGGEGRVCDSGGVSAVVEDLE